MNPDFLRYAFFGVFGLGAAFMLATNVIAFKVLRPAKKMGFLWWHVTAISISFLCFGSVVLARSFSRLGANERVDADWTTYLTAVGVLTYTAAQIIIFSVEKARLTQKIAARETTINGDAHLVYDASTEEGVIVPPEVADGR